MCMYMCGYMCADCVCRNNPEKKIKVAGADMLWTEKRIMNQWKIWGVK